MKIIEGLRANDLEGLVLPVIAIDQYESKIDDDSIVIAFFVHFKNAAVDLNRFIQKSAVDILDTEVSPAPTEEGLYLVFVELLRDEEFVKSLQAILATLNNLVNFSNWRFTAHKQEGVHDVNEENLQNLVRLVPETTDDVQDESLLQTTVNRLMDEGRRGNLPGSYMSMSDMKKLVENNLPPYPDDDQPYDVRAAYVAAILADHLLVTKYCSSRSVARIAARSVDEVGGAGGLTIKAWLDRAKKFVLVHKPK